jgi:signal transduction histidine kinase
LSTERARADENARLLGRVQRHAVLLDAVARAAEILLAAPTPEQGIERVLEILCTATESDRVCYAHFEFTPDDPELLGWRHITQEWNRPGAARKMATALRSHPMRRSAAGWEDKLAQLRGAGWVRQRVIDLTEPYRSELQDLGVDWLLRFSIFSGDQVVALLGFDCSGPYDDFEDATIDALQIVGSAISDALWRHALEQQAIATERSRADENARLASLLAQVVASSRLLIDVEPKAFEPAMLAWLGTMGSETRAMRATFYDRVPFPLTGQPTLRMLCEWVRDGVSGSVPCSFAEPHVIDPRGAEALMASLTAGRVLAVHTDETQSPMREFLASQGNMTVVAVPVFVGGEQWGAVSFDYDFRREIGSADAAVLQTAADTLSAVLRRNETAAALAAEREARLQAERQRSTELARANGALRRALDALAGSDGAAGFLRDVLVQLQLQTGALAAYLFSADDSDGRLHLLGRAHAGAFSAVPASDDPPMFSRGFELHPPLMDVLKPLGRFLWRRVDRTAPMSSDMLAVNRWHLTKGHEANAVHALMVGERQVGFIGMVFDSPEPLTKVQLDLAHALSQPITLALELSRLSRLAQRGSEQAAMLKERNRLAREIHDGIAQSFLAIQMQLDLLEEGAASPSPIQKAMVMARHGLTEARRAVAALRPQDLQSGDLPAAILRLLAQTEKRGSTRTELIRPAAWTSLPAEVEDHLFRIVQEAVNNALRHAQAGHIKVELSQAAGEATLLVSDDGVGFDPERLGRQRGFGLESMQQRAQLIGARIEWMTRVGQGTQVLLSWTAPT